MGFNSSNQSSSGAGYGNNTAIGGGMNMNYGTNQSGNYGQNQSSGRSQNFSQNTNQGQSQNTNQSQSQNTNQSQSQNKSQSKQDVYGAQSPYLQDVYAQAQNAFIQGMNDVNGMRPMVQGSMGNALDQAQGAYGNQMGGGFAQGLAGQVGPNAYTDALKGQIASDALKLKQQNLGSLDARAAAAGMSGSSGYRDQVGGMMDDVDKNALNQMSQLGFNSFDRGLQNQMAMAQMLDRNQQGAIGNLQNIQSGAMNMFNPAMLGQQMAANYAQTIGGPTVLGQSSSQGTSNSFGQGTSNSFGQGTSNSFGQGTSMGNSFNNSNGFNTGFSNGMNVGMGGNLNVGYGNNYNSSNGQGNSVGVDFTK